MINASEEIVFKEGKGIYEFSQNGKYDIIFYDKVGNEGRLAAVIDLVKDDTENQSQVIQIMIVSQILPMKTTTRVSINHQEITIREQINQNHRVSQMEKINHLHPQHLL